MIQFYEKHVSLDGLLLPSTVTLNNDKILVSVKVTPEQRKKLNGTAIGSKFVGDTSVLMLSRRPEWLFQLRKYLPTELDPYVDGKIKIDTSWTINDYNYTNVSFGCSGENIWFNLHTSNINNSIAHDTVGGKLIEGVHYFEPKCAIYQFLLKHLLRKILCMEMSIRNFNNSVGFCSEIAHESVNHYTDLKMKFQNLVVLYAARYRLTFGENIVSIGNEVFDVLNMCLFDDASVVIKINKTPRYNNPLICKNVSVKVLDKHIELSFVPDSPFYNEVLKNLIKYKTKELETISGLIFGTVYDNTLANVNLDYQTYLERANSLFIDDITLPSIKKWCCQKDTEE